MARVGYQDMTKNRVSAEDRQRLIDAAQAAAKNAYAPY